MRSLTYGSVATLAALLVASGIIGCNRAHPESGPFYPLDLLFTGPTVVATAPADNARNVAPTATISVRFSKAMNATTLTTNSDDQTCSGSLQVSADDFTTCIRMTAAPTANAGRTEFSLQPVSSLLTTNHKIRVTTEAQDAGGNALGAEFTTATGFRPQLFVVDTAPGAGATNVGTNASFSVQFSASMTTSSVTVNLAGDTSCSGSVQVSSNDFATCVEMAAQPTAATGDRSFSFSPNANLAASTAFRIRVATSVSETAGQTLPATFTTDSFTTAAGPDLTQPSVTATSPSAGATGVAVGTSISATFSEAIATATVTTNTADTTCSGSFQVSNDGFATCVRMTAAPAPSSGATVFTITPLTNLKASATYQIRITGAVMDLAGNGLLGAPFTASFTTTGKLMFVTALSYGANLGGITGGGSADTKCQSDTNYPGTGTYRALLVDGTTRRACTTANCSGGTAENINWALAANTDYYRRADGTTKIMTTNSGGVFAFGMLEASFGGGSNNIWTGLNTNWTTSGNDCSDWNGAAVGNGTTGLESAQDATAVNSGGGGLLTCLASNARILCVEQ